MEEEISKPKHCPNPACRKVILKSGEMEGVLKKFNWSFRCPHCKKDIRARVVQTVKIVFEVIALVWLAITINYFSLTGIQTVNAQKIEKVLCGSFPTKDSAYKYFYTYKDDPEIGKFVRRLDGDKDGDPCETLNKKQ